VDPDSSGLIREMAAQWSGLPEHLVPILLPSSDESTLQSPARLAYCGQCWTEDAEQRRSPYIRRGWTKWSCVTCLHHKTWLSAREPLGRYSSELGWASVWQVDSLWADAAHLPYDVTLLPYATGFEGTSVNGPDCPWQDFEYDLERLGRSCCQAALDLIAGPDYYGLRGSCWESLRTSEHCRRISDYHLHGYSQSRPGWIAGRITCLATAAEVLRMIEGATPAFRRIRRMLESRTALRLVTDCKSLWNRDQGAHYPSH
jgi:hypothetical protein